MEGVVRDINLALLEDDPADAWRLDLIHLGFALQKMTEAEVDEASSTLSVLGEGTPDDAYAGWLDEDLPSCCARRRRPHEPVAGARSARRTVRGPAGRARPAPDARGGRSRDPHDRRGSSSRGMPTRPTSWATAVPPTTRPCCSTAPTWTIDPGLVQLAQGFAGAWPYLEFIAGATGIRSPLDRRVVEAYWLGGPLLDTIDMTRFGGFAPGPLPPARRRATGATSPRRSRRRRPNYAFHVFGVYPWVGLLRTGRAGTPLEHLDKCRIRWGQVVSTEGDQVTVLSRPLTYDGIDIGLGDRRLETARRSVDGVGFLEPFRPGEWVRPPGLGVRPLSRRQLHLIQRSTLHQFDITNRHVVHSGPRAAIG